MENVKEGCGGAKSSNEEENPNNNNNNNNINNSSIEDDSLQPISRTPFTYLSQVDADLYLARTLQEQERAYMMLRMNGVDGSSDLGSSEAGSFLHEEEDGYDDVDSNEDDDEGDDVIGTDADEDAFDAHRSLEEEEEEDEVDSSISEEVEIDPSAFDNDEAFARALQDAEERELAARLMALTGGNDWTADDTENDNNSQDTWEEVDPDELSYEELLALGEVVGTESRGLSADTIASLPSVNYKAQSNQDGSAEQCVICRLEYEDEDTLTVLSCKHSYHSECINNWLQINKVCPVCSAEVSTSTNL